MREWDGSRSPAARPRTARSARSPRGPRLRRHAGAGRRRTHARRRPAARPRRARGGQGGGAPAAGEPGRRGQLDGYRNAFIGHYGDEREVGLLELLDPETGSARRVRATAGRAPTRPSSRCATRRCASSRSKRCGSGGSSWSSTGATLERVATGSPTAETAPTSLDVAVFVLAAPTQSTRRVRAPDRAEPRRPGGRAQPRPLRRPARRARRRWRRSPRAEPTASASSSSTSPPRPVRERRDPAAVHAYEIAAGTMPGVDRSGDPTLGGADRRPRRALLRALARRRRRPARARRAHAQFPPGPGGGPGARGSSRATAGPR